MPHSLANAIDCDIHPALPGVATLLLYLSEHWRETLARSGLADIDTVNYPPGSPLSARPDWRPAAGKPAAELAQVQRHSLDAWGLGLAILNPLAGVQAVHNEDLGATLARALNTWVAREWLDRDPRLRASIVLPTQSVERCVDEIEFWAQDRRFVQALVPVSGETPLGKRANWPVYAACERHSLTLGVHAGGTFRHAPTSVGWPSYYTEDYVNHAQAFQTQLTSLICEGVFSKFPGLRVVLIESGFTWLPAHVWHIEKFWKGLRMDVPWVDRPPFEIVRDHVRLTLQPIDAPPNAEDFERLMQHMGSDRLLLFSSDHPHWQFDGDAAMPDFISPSLARRIMIDNPREAYGRLDGSFPLPVSSRGEG